MSSIPPFAIRGEGRTLTFSIVVHDPTTAAEADADSFPTYRIYKDTGDTPVENGNMEKLDDANTVGTYRKQVDCSSWTEWSTYTIKCRAVVGGDPGGITLSTLCITAPWEASSRTLTSSSTAPGVGLTAQTWTVLRGDNLDRTFADIVADAGITKVQLTVKERDTQDDDKAILAVDSVTGLLRLNKTSPGAFTATFTTLGVLAVPAATMAELSQRALKYDVQVWHGTTVDTIEMGTFTITDDITRTVTP